MKKINEIKLLLDAKKVSKAYVEAIEDIYGFYQLKLGSDEPDNFSIANVEWNKIDGWHIEEGEFNPNRKVFKGFFIRSRMLGVDIAWLRSEINKFMESDWLNDSLEGKIENADIADFLDYGMEESNFEANPEAVLLFHPWKEPKEQILTIYETGPNLKDIAAGVITEGHGTDYSFRLMLKGY